MTKLGFKHLTLKNWLQPDKASLLLLSTTLTGTEHPNPSSRWINYVLEPRLSDQVPKEVMALFEVARATIAYGFLFYPLFTLGLEQLTRVGEAAIVKKCEIEKSPLSKRRFANGIEWLAQHSFLTQAKKRIWHSMRDTRNFASHPNSQSILPPGLVLGFLEKYAETINSLYTLPKL